MTKIHPQPKMVYADAKGQVYDHPELEMVVRSGASFRPVRRDELIPLPPGSELMALPDRLPLGSSGGEIVPLVGTQAVAAFMAPAYTQLGVAAWRKRGRASRLPLFAYTAVGWLAGRFYVAGFRSDPSKRQDPAGYDQKLVIKNVRRRRRESPKNALLRQLDRCACEYLCPAARNLFLRRWECPLPVSRSCNASCLGCISLQPSGCCPSPMERLSERPSVEDIVEVAVPHLARAPGAVVSFGQGCEGEPLSEPELLEASIREIRRQTSRGTINLNTNASLPKVIERLLEAGLDSVRVSLNSARKRYYDRYFRPRDYSFSAVVDSMRRTKRLGKFLSLNYFILPGFSDQPQEIRALLALMSKAAPDMIQLRNINIDPDYYLSKLACTDKGEGVGIREMMKQISKEFPKVRYGYFNPALSGKERA
jgi:wyosine [tRNA(Phe)-imidazoG37] synthetase (radical SAM superfamily)